MRSTVALCLIALVLAANATSFKEFPPMNLRPNRNIMTVLTQVEATIKSGGPIEIVKETLDKFEEEVTTEQAAHDALHERQTNECDAEYDFRRREVADASAALRDASTTLEGCQDQYRRASADLNWVQNTILENSQFLATLLDRREREATEFGQAQQSHDHNSHNVGVAVSILDEVFTGEVEFAALVSHAKVMLKGAVQTGKTEHFEATFGAFASLATAQGGADQETLERLRNVLENLRNKLEDDWNNRVHTEQEFIEAFEAAKANIESALEQLKEQEGLLTQEIVALNKCTVNQTGIVGSAQAKRDRNQKLWDDASALCEASNEEYEQAKLQRREERDVIDALRSKVEARYGTGQ